MGAECVGEFTVYKRAGSPHYTVIRLKTSFCSATYRPKAHRPIYRDLGALVHSKYLYLSVRHIALIVGTWSRSYPQGPRENNKAAPDASSGDGMIVRSDAPILRKQQTEARNPVFSLRNRKFESISLQQTVCLSPAAAFKGREPGFPRGFGQLACRPGQQRLAGCFDIASTGRNISVGRYSSTAVRLVVAPGLTRGRSVDL